MSVRVRACDARARARARALARSLGQVICDVSGPIGCHLSSRCRRVPPPSPCYLQYSLALPFSLPSFILLSPSYSFSDYLCHHPPVHHHPRMQSDPRCSLPLPSSRRVSSRFNPRDRPPSPSLPPLLTSLFALSLAGIFSLLPHPPSFPPPHCTSFHPLNPLSFHLFSAAIPMA